MTTCEVCGDEPSVGVAAVPGVPMSVSYGKRCLRANAHPLWILAANTAMSVDAAENWREHLIPEWQQMVDDTLRHLDKTEEEFLELVRLNIESLNNPEPT